MRLWCRPGVTFELGRLKVLIAPPDRLAALLDLPEIGSFHTLYLYTGLSEVLFRVPPIRSEHFETQVCTSLDDAIAAVSRSFHTVLMVEWSPTLAAGLDAEERGKLMSRPAKALKRRATTARVIPPVAAVRRSLEPRIRIMAGRFTSPLRHEIEFEDRIVAGRLRSGVHGVPEGAVYQICGAGKTRFEDHEYLAAPKRRGLLAPCIS